MLTGRTGSDVGSSPIIAGRKARWSRCIAIVTAIVYVVSAGFPMAAGLSHDTASFPSWWGTADVGIAFLLATLTFAVFGLSRGGISREVEDRSYALYRVLIHAIFATFSAFLLLGDRIVWSQCLTGFAWRYWLLLYGLPHWLAVWTAPPITTTDLPSRAGVS